MIKSKGARQVEWDRPYQPTTGIGMLLAVLVYMSLFAWTPSLSYGKEPISFSGITEPIKDVTLSATVVGTISAIFVKEGMSVRKGEAILELDKQLEAFEVERRKLIWEGKAEVAAAAVRVTTLQSLLVSTRELFNSTGSVSREELEKMALDYELAAAEKKRLETAEERELIEYEMARETLNKRSLISPFDGIVIKLFLDEGETCQENQPLAHVVDTSRGLFVCNVEEWIGRTLRKGQTVDLKIRTGSEPTAKTGTVVFVSPVVDPASGLLEVKTEFDNQDGSIRPGVAGFLFLKGR